jgi:hypothetical protein
MANRRMLDSAFWEDRAVQAKLSRTARYLFIGLISHADDEGRAIADPVWLKSRVFLYDDDVSHADVQTALEEIAGVCRSVCLYDADGEQFVAFLKWEHYQSIKNSRGSSLPEPPADPIPTVSKPGPKRKLRAESDNEPIGSDSSPILSDGIADEMQSNGNRIGEELVLREEKGIEEKNGVTDVTPSDADAPPRLSVVGGNGNGNGKVSARKKKPETAEEAELREMQKSLQAKLGRYPFSKNNAKFLTRYREHGPEAIERAVEEWRERTRDADRFDDMAVLKAIDSALRVSRPKTADPGF